MNFRYPIFLDLTGKKCLITGAGFEVAGKVRALVDAGANVTYVNPDAEESIRELADEKRLLWKPRKFRRSDLKHCFLVITDGKNNSVIFELAEKRGVLCNSVDDPPRCRFSFGSIHRQGDLTIAISTNGQAPAVAVRLRQKLQRDIGPEYAALLAMLKVFRPSITASLPTFNARRDLWYRLVDSSVLEVLKNGEVQKAGEIICKLIEEAITA